MLYLRTENKLQRFWTSPSAGSGRSQNDNFLQDDTSVSGKIWIHPLFFIAIAATVFIFLSGIIYFAIWGNPAKKSSKPPVEGELVAENDSYQVYLVNQKDLQASQTLTVYDKNSKKKLPTNILYTKSGTPVLFNDTNGRYVLLSTGVYTTGAINPRVAMVISLADSARTVNDFCHAGNPFFWNDYVIYDGCDRYTNRPWGNGEAPSILARNLKTDKEQTLFQSTSTSQYRVVRVNATTLEGEEYYVGGELDWRKAQPNKRRATYNLLRLN